MKCPRCQQDNPARAEFCLRCGAPVDGLGPSPESYADLKGEIERLRRSLGEALEQQTATSEVLKVISRSAFDLQPVFDVVVENAVRLCEADRAVIFRFDGILRAVASYNASPKLRQFLEQNPFALGRRGAAGRAALERRTVHIPDAQADPEYRARAAQVEPIRTILGVPMLKGDDLLGVIVTWKREVKPFNVKQIALLETFADQAVIAIENVRLFNETKEALEQQTATAEILAVISNSPTNVKPVLDTIAQRAVRLCAGFYSLMFLSDGERLHLAATNNVPAEGLQALEQRYPLPLSSEQAKERLTVRAMSERRVLQVLDMQSEDNPSSASLRTAAAIGHRAVIAVPLIRQAEPIGVLIVSRRDPRGFAEKEVALLQAFTDQAVIAIENVRLFTELEARNQALTEALAQQTATSEILQVISGSPTDAQPVFDAIVTSVVRLCGGVFSTALHFDGERLHLLAQHNVSAEGLAALRRIFPARPTRDLPAGRAILERALVHIPDSELEPYAGLARTIGWRSALIVPMLRDGAPIGVLTVSRATSGRFSDSEIALVKIFADQAVIAVENVRLFQELQIRNRDLTAALEQQTATGDILKAISSSPNDVQPVFDAIVGRATRLCEADLSGLYRFDGALIHFAAQYGRTLAELEAVRQAFPQSPGRFSVTSRAILDATVVQVADVRTDHEIVDALRSHFRTVLAVPMLRDGRPIGTITVARRIVRPFTDEEIALLQTFADQAVIAVENVRLFTELQASNRDLTTALDKQTATSDILRVISGSQTDVQPVFDAIMKSAVRLLRAYTGALIRVAGDQIELAAHMSTDEAAAGALRVLFPRSLQAEGPAAQTVRDRAPVNIADQQTDPQVPEPVRAMARVSGHRSVVWVPLLRHDEAVGGIGVTRLEPGGFTDDEIALLQTFADQAVIAIENVRLFTELEEKNRALTTAHAQVTASLEQQTASGEILRVISSSPTDIGPVFDAIVRNAVRLCGGVYGTVYRSDGQMVHLVPDHTFPQDQIDLWRTLLQRVSITGQVYRVDDLEAEAGRQVGPGSLANWDARGRRSFVIVPMVAAGQVLGAVGVTHADVNGFSDTYVELLQTFADQAVIAIENVRLFNQLEAANRDLAAASRHKSDFLANMSHELRTPLNAVIGFSEVLSEGMFGQLNAKQEEYARDIYSSGQHLLSLINDILDLSKIEAGRMELEISEFHLPAALDNALTLVRERAGRRGIALGMTVDERLGEVQADERKIRQVVLNLLSNAIKFTPEGGRIEVRAAPVNGAVEVSVSDTGVGIAPEDQEAIFEEFKQVGTAAKKVEGTGLGLALSRKFIELHGGRIWVKSTVGVGSTFTFSVPVAVHPDQVRP